MSMYSTTYFLSPIVVFTSLNLIHSSV